MSPDGAGPKVERGRRPIESIPPRFCPRCGAAIPDPPGGARPTCPRGDYTWFDDPKLAAGVLVARPRPGCAGTEGAPSEPELLLVRRNHAPALGRWAFPSGFVDAGEIVEEAATREVREETGVEVRIDGLLGVYSEAGNAVVFVAYAGTLVSGTAVAGDEAFEVGWFAPGALPDLAFPHDDQIVADWRQQRASDPARV